MDNDELKEGQSGTLNAPYLVVEYDYPQVLVRFSSGLEFSVWSDEVDWDEPYDPMY